eukprot:symbB.v1.2.002812.t1/scaffold91.1/size338584/17
MTSTLRVSLALAISERTWRYWNVESPADLEVLAPPLSEDVFPAAPSRWSMALQKFLDPEGVVATVLTVLFLILDLLALLHWARLVEPQDENLGNLRRRVYLCCTLIVNFHIFAVSSPSAVGSTTNQKTTTAVRTSHRGVLAKSLVVMDVTVANAQGLPEKAYLSLRAGDVRKQTQYRPGGECFSFDGKQTPRQLVVDVFEKVGSAQVSVSDLASCGTGNLVQLQGRDGSIVLDMQAKVHSSNSSNEPKKPRVSRHQAALDAQAYLEAHSVQRVLQGMVRELLTSRPSDPFSFMMGYIQASSSESLPSLENQEQQQPVGKEMEEEVRAGEGDRHQKDWSTYTVTGLKFNIAP